MTSLINTSRILIKLIRIIRTSTSIRTSLRVVNLQKSLRYPRDLEVCFTQSDGLQGHNWTN